MPLTELILINTVVSLFAGLLPIPGGIGVSEAGLTLGLTAAGLSSEIAFAIALAYRMVSFYLPPIWGCFSYRWLISAALPLSDHATPSHPSRRAPPVAPAPVGP